MPVLGLALVAAAVAYVTGVLGARLLGAKIASFVGLTEVLFAVLFAWLLLGQVLTPGSCPGGCSCSSASPSCSWTSGGPPGGRGGDPQPGRAVAEPAA